MIRTRPASETRRTCARHPERLATRLRVTTLPAGKLPAQTVYRPECSECAQRDAKSGEKVKSL